MLLKLIKNHLHFQHNHCRRQSIIWFFHLVLAYLTLVSGGCVRENLPQGYTLVSPSSAKAYKFIKEEETGAHHAHCLCREDKASLAMPKTADELNEIMSLNREWMIIRGREMSSTEFPIPSCREVLSYLVWEFPCPAWAVASCSSGPQAGVYECL